LYLYIFKSYLHVNAFRGKIDRDGKTLKNDYWWSIFNRFGLLILDDILKLIIKKLMEKKAALHESNN
jgi:hypothetical protein